MYEVGKHSNGYSLQMPHGVLVYKTKKAALMMSEACQEAAKVDDEFTTVGQLHAGQFAITLDNKMGIMAISQAGFTPAHASDACVVHLANGIGGFPATTKCMVVEMDEAIEAAKKFMGA